MLNKITLALVFVILIASSSQTVFAADKYIPWDALSSEQKLVHYKYRKVILDVRDFLEGMEGSLNSVAYFENNMHDGQQNEFRNMNSPSFNYNLQALREKTTLAFEQYMKLAIFHPDDSHRINTLVSDLIDKRVGPLLEGVFKEYNDLKSKKDKITESDTDQLKAKIKAKQTEATGETYLPKNADAAKKIVFPDNAVLRPLPPSAMKPKEEKAEPLKPAPVVEQVVEQKVIVSDVPKIKKAPLPEEVGKLMAEIGKEIEDRQGLTGPETVMAYGQVLAPKYFGPLKEKVLIRFFPDLNVLKQGTLGSIVEFRNSLLVKGVINQSITEQDQFAQATLGPDVDKFDSNHTMPTGIKPGEIWAVTYNVVKMIYDEKDDNTAQNLAGIYFMALVEQGGKCKAGGIGRHFPVLKQACQILIDRKYD